MGNLFGRPKRTTSRVTDQDKAVLQLKQQRDKLRQYQKKITMNLARERDLARKLLSEGKRDRAKLILKKKRYQEQIMSKTEIQLENLEVMVHDLEFAQIEVQVIEGLKVGNEALKKIHQVLTVEEVEKVLDETQEAVEKQQEIDALLSGMLTEDDEEAVLEELDDLIRESLPNVPEKKLRAEEEEKEEEMLDLPSVPENKLTKGKHKEKKERRKEKVLVPAS